MKRDKVIGAILLVVALSAISGLALITVFIFREGIPIILRVGARQFFLSTDWEPTLGHFGILSMLVGSLVVTVGAVIVVSANHEVVSPCALAGEPVARVWSESQRTTQARD